MQKNLTLTRSKAWCVFCWPCGPKKPSPHGSSWASEALRGRGELGKEVKDDWELAIDCNEDLALRFPVCWVLSAATSAPSNLLALVEDARWHCSSVNFKHRFTCTNTCKVVCGAHRFGQPAPAHQYLRAVPCRVHSSTVNVSRRLRWGQPTTLTSSSNSTLSTSTSTSVTVSLASTSSRF